jgi:3D (Asp-Asp-Asp) domain-containing protein
MRHRLIWCLLLVAILQPSVYTGKVAARSTRHIARVWVTGYTWTGNRTADGSWPHWGTAASDPGTIPLHTLVAIKGLGRFWIDDTGGSVHGYHLDVFCRTVIQAYAITGYYTARWRE